ncbi:MAG: hypothetical protein ACPGSB_06305, partial [Opitutales bacterium]
NGERYLSGLRFRPDFKKRPPPSIWRQAFADMLSSADVAWTCIGKANTRARKILESGHSVFPEYRPRAELVTWFIPLPKGQTKARPEACAKTPKLEAAEWRHVAIASGSGISYSLGRTMHIAGLPGIPSPGTPIRIAYLHVAALHGKDELVRAIKKTKGYDGIVIILEKDSEADQAWRPTAPKLSWKWESLLYQVSWNRDQPDQEIPEWKGIWL